MNKENLKELAWIILILAMVAFSAWYTFVGDKGKEGDLMRSIWNPPAKIKPIVTPSTGTRYNDPDDAFNP